MPLPREIQPYHLVGLCLWTESGLEHEWGPILQVILNRNLSPKYPDGLKAVVLQPYQFSAFNNYTKYGHVNTIFDAMIVDYSRKHSPAILCHAIDFARERLSNVNWEDSRVSRDTLHYFSPISMNPPGSVPSWFKFAERSYTPAGIDPKRFVYCTGVP